MTHVTASLTILAFRGYKDDAAEGSATPYANQNVDWYQPWDINFRARLNCEETNGGADSNTALQWQYRHIEGTNSWTNITTTSSVIKAVTSTHITDAADTTAQLTGTGSYLTLNAGFTEDGLAGGGTLDFVGNDRAETECALQVISTDVSQDDTIELRCTFNGTAPAGTPTLPTITVGQDTNRTGTAADSLSGIFSQSATGDVIHDVTGTVADALESLATPTETVDTYYFNDSTPFDPGSAWSNDANAFNGSTSSSAQTLVSGTESSNYLQGDGTTAPASGDNISLVEFRVHSQSSLGSPLIRIYDGSDRLDDFTITSETSPTWSTYSTIATPYGGWTWAKIQNLRVRIWAIGASPTVDIYALEIRVTSNSELLHNVYHFDASDAGPTDPDSVWTNDASGFDGSPSTATVCTTAGSVTTNEITATGTNAPATGEDIEKLFYRVKAYCSGTLPRFNIQIHSGTELVESDIITIDAVPVSPRDWVELKDPEGGWTWAKVQALKATCWLSGTEVTAGGIYVLEIRVQSNQLYTITHGYFDASDSGPTDPDNAWISDNSAYDGGYTTTANTSSIGTETTNELSGVGTTINPSLTETIVRVDVRAYGSVTGSSVQLNVNVVYGGSDVIALPIQHKFAESQWSSWREATLIPGGSWSWSEVAALGNNHWVTGSTLTNANPSITEVRVFAEKEFAGTLYTQSATGTVATPTSDIAKMNVVTYANMKMVNGVLKANIKNINSVA